VINRVDVVKALNYVPEDVSSCTTVNDNVTNILLKLHKLRRYKHNKL